MRMHDDEVEIDAADVRRLLSGQLPDLAGLPLERVASTGTVNALFRVGDRFVARLPLVERWSDGIDREWTWIPWLREHVSSVGLPEPIFRGEPDERFPFRWSVYRWIDGAPYDDDLIEDERSAAETLARFVLELRGIEIPEHAPIGGRDPLLALDHDTGRAIRDSAGVIDAEAAMAVWERALEAPVWDGEASWIHGDLLRPNVIVHEGRVSAVIDFGYIGIGDPATDLIPSWSVFAPAGRNVFRSILDPDEGSWVRGRGIALHQAAMIVPYYMETNPGFAELARRTIEQIIVDAGL